MRIIFTLLGLSLNCFLTFSQINPFNTQPIKLNKNVFARLEYIEGQADTTITIYDEGKPVIWFNSDLWKKDSLISYITYNRSNEIESVFELTSKDTTREFYTSYQNKNQGKHTLIRANAQDTIEIWTKVSTTKWIHEYRNQYKTEYFLDLNEYPTKVVTTAFKAVNDFMNIGSYSDEKSILEIDTTNLILKYENKGLVLLKSENIYSNFNRNNVYKVNNNGLWTSFTMANTDKPKVTFEYIYLDSSQIHDFKSSYDYQITSLETFKKLMLRK